MLRKASFIVLLFVVAMSIWGCSYDSNPVESTNHQDIPDVDIVDNSIKIVEGVMHVTDGGYTITISPGGEFGENVFSYGDFNISVNTNSGTIVEWNETDRLSVTMISRPNYLHETYSINGQEFVVEHDGEPNEDALPAFIEFYERNQTTLSEDDDGWILNSVLNNKMEDIISAVDDYDMQFDDNGEKRPSIQDIVCSIATLCTGIKCWFGGIINPWCVGCSGATTACALMELWS